MNKKNDDLILVYGSLRKGEYNYKHFESGLEFLDTLILTGYNLYSLGSYPGIKKTKDKTRTLEVDLFKVTDYNIGEGIDKMELGANYYIENILTAFGVAKLYVYNGNINNSLLVKSGNWKTR